MIMSYKDYKPSIHESCFIASSSTIVGNCSIDENSSVWYNAVIRADCDQVSIGKNSNVQDGCVIHCDYGLGVKIGDNVTIGHNAIIHGCTINDNCIIGMGATILNGAVIGENVIIGANSLVSSYKEIPSNSLVIGVPGKVVRTLTDEEIEKIQHSAKDYIRVMNEHKGNVELL